MKTDAERMALIRQRTTQLQRQARARQILLIDAGCMAACLVLVVCLGLAMPGWAAPGALPCSWCWAWPPACFRLMSAAFSWGGTSAVP